MSKPLRILLIVLFAALAAVTLWRMVGPGNQAIKARDIPRDLARVLIPEPRPLKPFKLAGADGQPLNLARLKGQWSLLFFGYTHCPDICPTAMGLLGEVFEILEKKPDGGAKGIFVSVDPKRDTLELLKDYVGYFNPGFLGATGDEKAIEGFTRQMLAGYFIHPPEDPEDPESYLVSHTSAIYLVGPQGRLLGAFRPPHDAADIVDKFLRIKKMF